MIDSEVKTKIETAFRDQYPSGMKHQIKHDTLDAAVMLSVALQIIERNLDHGTIEFVKDSDSKTVGIVWNDGRGLTRYARAEVLSNVIQIDGVTVYLRHAGAAVELIRALFGVMA